MIRTEDIQSVTKGNVHGSDGEKIGSVGQVYLDNQSGQPAWVTVKTGMFGSKASFVPLAEATVEGADLRVPYDKETIKKAPNVDADGDLTPAEEDELYRYYKLGSGDRGQTGDRAESEESSPRHETGDAAAADAAGGVGSGHRGDEHGRDESSKDREQPREHRAGEHDGGTGQHEETSGEAGGERRIRRYIVTEETITRREEEIPRDSPTEGHEHPPEQR